MEDAIESVVNQTYPNVELIIADDNSSKKEVYEIIAKYQYLKNVKYFNSNIGQEDRLKTARYATQINTAVTQYATGDYLAYLADDDYYYPQMLEKFAETIMEKKYDVMYCCQDVVDVDKKVCGTRYFDGPLKRGLNVLDHNQVITSKDSFYKVGGWPDNPELWGGADGWFWLKLEIAEYLFHPIDFTEPLQAKRYREHSVQWNVANGLPAVIES